MARSHPTPAQQLAQLPAAALARMVIRLTAALEGLLRGGADGSTSGDRIHSANRALDAAYRMQGEGDHRPTFLGQTPVYWAGLLALTITLIGMHWIWQSHL